ncbi:fimbrial protein [Fibrobacter sp. UWB5]|uniref:fimbrial protein n=1 Tax=Fibrobacter sp. UWB5 TaxID=1964360 RepID=UPI000B520520|nr:fimbrial protein [Fibrobacter sp. UWB5]OWV10039.1 fimbrial protein [Fibrobacter sp. UWB5]
MKNAFQIILALTIVGLLALVVAAFYFGAPLFGWIIMAAIFAVFIGEQLVALKMVKQIATETDILETCEKRGGYVTGDGVVAKRVALARNLLAKNIRLDSSMAYEVLSNSVEIAVPKSAGGTVILLGLMGTFFGLMYSVATAGGAIDNSTTQGTLDTIQLLFQNMKGIFGTSLCGLFAALILNASRNMMVSARDAFVARLDALTLDLQGAAGDGSEEAQAQTELERLFDSVEKNLAVVASSVKDGLSGVVAMVGDELSAMTTKLNESLANVSQNMNKAVENLGPSVKDSLAGAFTPMEQNIKTLSASVESIPGKLDEKLNGISSTLKASLEGVASATESAMNDSTKNVAAAVADQVKQSGEQWKSFMERLAAETSANVDSQKEGLETLKNVALQVAEKAQAGSAELSNSVAEKLSALSSDILGAFQKLSETSAVLLEAQKALTESIDNRVVKEKEATDALGGNIVETAELMRVNQSELSANLEMLRAGLETILEKLSGDTAERDDEESFVEHLNQSLEAFHERASEVLMENAVKTQEILLEVLEQTQRSAVQQPKVEG